VFLCDSITVIDDKGVEAPAIQVKILYCSKCSGHGTCDQSETRDGDNSQSYNYLLCHCNEGWTGMCLRVCEIYYYIKLTEKCNKQKEKLTLLYITTTLQSNKVVCSSPEERRFHNVVHKSHPTFITFLVVTLYYFGNL